MAVRARPLFPALALLLAVASIIALSVALPGPAGAVVSADPDDGTCDVGDGRVNAVVYLGGTVYLGGSFTQVDGQTRNRLAACDAATGNLLSWNPNANGVVRALKVSPAGTTADLTVSASGNTVFVGGRASGGYVQAYGPNVGGTPVWNVGTNGDVEALAVSSSILYVGGHFTSIGGGGPRPPAAPPPPRARRLPPTP